MNEALRTPNRVSSMLQVLWIVRPDREERVAVDVVQQVHAEQDRQREILAADGGEDRGFVGEVATPGRSWDDCMMSRGLARDAAQGRSHRYTRSAGLARPWAAYPAAAPTHAARSGDDSWPVAIGAGSRSGRGWTAGLLAGGRIGRRVIGRLVGSACPIAVAVAAFVGRG